MTNKIEDENREAFQKIKEKSEDDFEKYLTFISAGALGLSITFIEKLVPLENATNVWFLISGWIFLAITLLVNLFSHIFSALMIDKSNEDLDNDGEAIHDLITKRNKKIDLINYATLFTLMIGIASIILFTSKNAINMAKSNDKPTKPSQENYEDKGRKIPKPKQTVKPNQKSN